MMMDWDQVKTLLDVARMANDHPKLHNLRNVALNELEAHMAELTSVEEVEED